VTKQSLSYGSLCAQAGLAEAEEEEMEEEETEEEVVEEEEKEAVKAKTEVEKIAVPKSIRGILRWSQCHRSLCVCTTAVPIIKLFAISVPQVSVT
jgi:hypothetical protein